MNLKSSGIAIIALVLTCLLLGSAVAILYYQQTVIMTAHIKVVGDFSVYLDEACTEEAISYDWGEYSIVTGNEVKKLTLWFKSEANAPLEITWRLDDADGTWSCGKGTFVPGYYDPSYTSAPEDLRWLLIASFDTDVYWIPEDSAEVETALRALTFTLANAGDKQAVTVTLQAMQSATIYDPLAFDLVFTSHDVYP